MTEKKRYFSISIDADSSQLNLVFKFQNKSVIDFIERYKERFNHGPYFLDLTDRQLTTHLSNKRKYVFVVENGVLRRIDKLKI